MQPLDDYTRKLIQTRRRGLVYPYELVPLLAGDGGTFVEHDLDDDGRAGAGRSAARAEPGRRRGRRREHADRRATPRASRASPCSATRRKAMGSITEAECRRLLAAIDLAAAMDVPIEWFALSAGRQDRHGLRQREPRLGGPRAAPARRAHPAGGEVNVVVAGINVGAQPYWNAEATMLMHTRGILVMTPDSAMVLTGKQAIDYSGGVSAEDNLGIGGYGRVMGPNGEAQYWAPSLAAACDVLFDHYELTYRAPGERWPRRGGDQGPARPRRARAPPRRRRRRASRPSATSSRRPPTPTARSRSTSAR